MATPSASPAAVQVKRTFAAPREKVFQAWIDPKLMTKWFARCRNCPPAEILEADARPGGRCRIQVVDEKGKLYRGQGVYREVRLPERLVFTWSWDHDDYGDSFVVVEFRALGQSNFTEVTLTHERLPERAIEDHRKGWGECLDMLERALAEAA
jgi:uncharacterized protein YndB with AHSA1/START domain